MTHALPSSELLERLVAIVGRRHVLTSAAATRRFTTGYRFGGGAAEAVVRPGSLIELWRVATALAAADRIIIVQAANTGLTGGSTPDGDYDRPVVVIATMRLGGIHLIDGGAQVVCLPGATLDALERRLRPLEREPHSVIGSSCIGASVIGGICNNSGGALVRRGPAYTELALYARIEADGALRLVNNLGIALGDDPETVLRRVEAGEFAAAAIAHDERRAASDRSYHRRVRDIDASTPARFNADPSRLFEASGSAGRMIVLAVRLDTFARETSTETFYVGSNDPAVFTQLRRALLTEIEQLPISAEYLHRDAFDLAARYGKDVFLAIRWLGTRRLPALFAAKARFDTLARRLRVLPADCADRCLQFAAALLPDHLPRRLRAFRDRFEHHLILQVGKDGAAETRALLDRLFPGGDGYFACDIGEARAAFLHRFATASAAIRYRALHPRETEGIVALDIALRRNDTDWFEVLPADVARPIVKALYYGHFLCHVFHQDYLVAKGHDPLALEHRLWALLDRRGAEYPAEHNVGHLYPAKPALIDHYRALDPGNRLNPGIGQTSRARDWMTPSP